jgi:hypothetical protein
MLTQSFLPSFPSTLFAAAKPRKQAALRVARQMSARDVASAGLLRYFPIFCQPPRLTVSTQPSGNAASVICQSFGLGLLKYLMRTPHAALP